jgi:hypothetical protein
MLSGFDPAELATPPTRPTPAGLFSFQEQTMAIPDYARTNFQTLLRAAQDGNLALMECLDAGTREPRFFLCAVGREDGDYVFMPFGHLADGNPYNAYLPPDPGNASGILPESTVGSSEGGRDGNPS